MQKSSFYVAMTAVLTLLGTLLLFLSFSMGGRISP